MAEGGEGGRAGGSLTGSGYSTANREPSTAYRPDIDGLRGVAVLVVVLFHAGVPFFTGGYVGVDVFFVISGYLITGILLRSLAQNRYSYLGFMARRARRLIPGTLPVLAATTLAVLAFRPPEAAEFFGREISEVALLTANFLFYERTGYFGPDAESIPLLHTWSLVVEAQFYLAFPLALWALWRLGALALGWGLLAIAIVSFAACLIVQPTDPRLAFFLAPFRVWELVAGGLVAWRATRGRPLLGWLGPSALRTGVACLGLLLIVLSATLFGADTPHPGMATLIPVFGAALLIAAGEAPAGSNEDAPGLSPPVSRLLGAGPLLWLGLVSYSFYLWHWPVLVFAREAVGGSLSPVQTGGAVALALGLAAVSWRFVEEPFRRSGPPASGGWRRFRTGIGSALAAGAILAAGGALQLGDGFPQRLSPESRATMAREYTRFGIMAMRCDDVAEQTVRDAGAVRTGKICLFGAETGAPVVALWGDSHANAFAPALDLALREQGLRGVLITQGNCPPTLGHPEFDLSYQQDCARQTESIPALIDAWDLPAVVIVANWSNYIHDPERWAQTDAALTRTIERLRRPGRRFWIATPLPQPSENVPSQAFAHAHLGAPLPAPSSRKDYLLDAAPAFASFARLAQAPDVDILDQHEAVCDTDSCFSLRLEPMRDGGKGLFPAPLYADSSHLNAAAARAFSKALAPLAQSLRR